MHTPALPPRGLYERFQRHCEGPQIYSGPRSAHGRQETDCVTSRHSQRRLNTRTAQMRNNGTHYCLSVLTGRQTYTTHKCLCLLYFILANPLKCLKDTFPLIPTFVHIENKAGFGRLVIGALGK